MSSRPQNTVLKVSLGFYFSQTSPRFAQFAPCPFQRVLLTLLLGEPRGCQEGSIWNMEIFRFTSTRTGESHDNPEVLWRCHRKKCCGTASPTLYSSFQSWFQTANQLRNWWVVFSVVLFMRRQPVHLPLLDHYSITTCIYVADAYQGFIEVGERLGSPGVLPEIQECTMMHH